MRESKLRNDVCDLGGLVSAAELPVGDQIQLVFVGNGCGLGERGGIGEALSHDGSFLCEDGFLVRVPLTGFEPAHRDLESHALPLSYKGARTPYARAQSEVVFLLEQFELGLDFIRVTLSNRLRCLPAELGHELRILLARPFFNALVVCL